MEIHFEWDPGKAASNLRKHGISFTEATNVFRDPLALTVYDPEHSQTEERWVTIGDVHGHKLVVTVHTWHEENDITRVRIISARPATANEANQYRG